MLTLVSLKSNSRGGNLRIGFRSNPGTGGTLSFLISALLIIRLLFMRIETVSPTPITISFALVCGGEQGVRPLLRDDATCVPLGYLYHWVRNWYTQMRFYFEVALGLLFDSETRSCLINRCIDRVFTKDCQDE